MERRGNKLSSILFGIIMVIVLVFPFYMFSHMAEKRQARQQGTDATVSSGEPADISLSAGEDGLSKTSGEKLKFTWKTVLILGVGVLAAALRFRHMRQMREQEWEKRIR